LEPPLPLGAPLAPSPPAPNDAPPVSSGGFEFSAVAHAAAKPAQRSPMMETQLRMLYECLRVDDLASSLM
jgi:hypothetical protein